MKKIMALALGIATLSLGACGGGGGTSSTNSPADTNNTVTSVTGYSLPSEISAVPANNSSTATAVRVTAFQQLLTGAAHANLPADADYNTIQTKKYVEERTLAQFDIIETILNVLAQTHYDLAENIGQGPYTAIVSWEQQEQGRSTKNLQPWVVQSEWITENNQQVNRVQVWIEEPDMMNPGQMRTIRAEFKIYRSASTNPDGSYRDYGEWDFNVSFADDNSRYFAASSRIDASGNNTIMIHEFGADASMPDPASTRGILVRAGDTGYGKVSTPDFDACFSMGGAEGSEELINNICTPPDLVAQYVYNDSFLVVDENTANPGDETAKTRDLNQAAEVTQSYGLFYANADASKGIAAGDSVQKHVNFGFPVTYTDSNGTVVHAYYGAWQGRHELWGGDSLQTGDTVSRADLPSGGQAQTYTVSKKFQGTLTKRALIDADLSDIQGISLEIYLFDNKELIYDGGNGAWLSCDGFIDNSTTPSSCMSFDNTPINFEVFNEFDELADDAKDRKSVMINKYDPITFVVEEYAYLNQDPLDPMVTYSGPGFYPAQASIDPDTNKPVMLPMGNKYTPSDGDLFNISIDGSTYIMYDGDFSNGKTGWVEKGLLNFDEVLWVPVFDPASDRPFSPVRGEEYYINNNGTNFIVRRLADADAASSYDVKIELQQAANPANVGSFLPPGASYLASPWDPGKRYQLVTDANSNDFLLLAFSADDPSTTGDETGQVQTAGQWGLQAYGINGNPLKADGTEVQVDSFGFPVDPNERPVEFNWEYDNNTGWGGQRFLMSDASTYEILSDPIQLDPLTLSNGAGDAKTLSLQYDGWMMGIPDSYFMLIMNNFEVTQEIRDKIINIPAGTLATGAKDGVRYLIKPLEVSVFLDEVPNTTPGLPTLSQADSVDLASVPDFVDHQMGAKPANTVVKYSEGKPVE